MGNVTHQEVSFTASPSELVNIYLAARRSR
jgi:hypothetical protein